MKARTLGRLLRSFDRSSDTACWHWRRATDRDGYGKFWIDGGMRLAHRVIYELLTGPISPGLVLDHLCRTPRCVNPRHLDAVTQRQNVHRGNSGRPQATRTHCPRDHEYTEANTYRHGGRRFCRACQNARSRKATQISALTGSAVGAQPTAPGIKETA